MSQEWRSKGLRYAKGVAQALDDVAASVPDAVPRLSQYTATAGGAVLSALEQFHECVRYLNTRRSKGAIINISGEDDLQDVLYLMLRPWIPDLIPENPTDRVASRFAIKDFLSKDLGTVVEAKFIRDKKHGRDISKELHDDIEMYRNHPDCSELVFFIYDPNALIPDVRNLRRQVEGARDYTGKRLWVHCVVRP